MKITELIDQIERENPKLLDGIPENRAEALVRSVFRHVNETLARTEDGVVIFVGLGRFRVRKMEREVDGKKVPHTQIIFRRAAEAKEGAPGKAARAGKASGATGKGG